MNDDHTPFGRRYTVNEAAEVLGISAEAVRARMNRGTLHKEKDTRDGTVYVRMNDDHTHPDDRTNGRTDGNDGADHTVGESLAFQLVQEQVDYLRQQLQVWQEEARRKDHIIAALTERIPELEAASEPRGESVSHSEDSNNGDVPPEQEPRSWWRRLFEG